MQQPLKENSAPDEKTSTTPNQSDPHPTGKVLRSAIQYFVFLDLYGRILIMSGGGGMLTMKEFGMFSLLLGK